MNNDNIQYIVAVLRQIGLVAIGAIIPIVISYLATKRREKVIIKIHIQTKTSEQLIDSIKTYSDNLETTLIPLSKTLEKYSDQVKNGDKKISNYTASLLKDEALEIVENYIESWDKCLQTFSNIISILVSKEVIFNRFIGFRELLIDENDYIKNIYGNILKHYYSNIYMQLISNNQIEYKNISILKEYEKQFNKKKIDILNYSRDLHIAAQNEFLSRLFRYKVPLREQEDNAVPVCKSGFKYNRIIK